MHAQFLQLPDCGRVEYGATWFHGIEGNPLYEHAVRLGLIDRKEAERERMLDAAQLLNTYFPNTVLQSSNAHAAAEPTWGAIKYVREGEPQLLNEEDAAMMTKARDQYSQAVESSLAAAQTGSPAVVGQGVRQAFHQVRVMPKLSVRALRMLF